MIRTVLAALLVGAAPLAAQQPLVHRIPVSGEIENGLAPFVARALRNAEAAGAAAAFLDLDTPGGRVDAAERIVDAVRDAKLPVYAFVDPRAYSAGALIALATKGIYMKPGAVLGAATPVDGSGTRAPEKYVSAMRGEFRALAEQHGLDPRIAEKMVDENLEIDGLSPKGRLVTLSTSEALAVKYARAEVQDLAAFLAAIGLPGATVVSAEPNWAERLVGFLTSPVVSPVLLSLGVLGLLAEIKTGAFGLGGLVSLASLGLFFGSGFLLGLAGWEEIILLALGLGAIAVEVLVLPGFGFAGVLGAVLVAAATVLTLLGGAPSGGDVAQAFAILGASVVITLAVAYAWLRHLPTSHRFRGLLLQRGVGSTEGFVAALPRGDLVGQEGVALTDLRPSGVAQVAGERMDVVTEGEYVAAGSPVRVLRSEGYRHVVSSLRGAVS
jgi:membrane-bound serine protease (ClpP class)